MPEYGFSLTLVLPYKERIYDSVHVRENTVQRKLVFWHNLRTKDIERECFCPLIINLSALLFCYFSHNGQVNKLQYIQFSLDVEKFVKSTGGRW